MHTRGGFGGAVHVFLPSLPGHGAHRGRDDAARIRGSGGRRRRALPDPAAPVPERSRSPAGGQLLDRRTPVLFNTDITIYLARPTESDDAYFANGDGDELWFVHEGSAKLESPCGWLDVKAGDYVWVPKALIHRWHVGTPGSRALVLRGARRRPGAGAVPKPGRASSGWTRRTRTATSCARVGPIATPDTVPEGPRELFVKRAGTFHAVRARAVADGRRRVGRVRLPVRVRDREVPAEDGARSPAADDSRDVRGAGVSGLLVRAAGDRHASRRRSRARIRTRASIATR